MQTSPPNDPVKSTSKLSPAPESPAVNKGTLRSIVVVGSAESSGEGMKPMPVLSKLAGTAAAGVTARPKATNASAIQIINMGSAPQHLPRLHSIEFMLRISSTSRPHRSRRSGRRSTISRGNSPLSMSGNLAKPLGLPVDEMKW